MVATSINHTDLLIAAYTFIRTKGKNLKDPLRFF